MYAIKSRHDITIRLTDERWAHIVEEHCELAGMLYEILDAVALPDRFVEGNRGECLAVKAADANKSLVV